MKHLVVGLAGPIALVAGCLTVGPAAADTPDHFSRAEFRQVRTGMTAARVEQIADIPGVLMYQGHGYMSRNYRGWINARHERMRVSIDYQMGRDGHWHLVSKWASVPSPCSDC